MLSMQRTGDKTNVEIPLRAAFTRYTGTSGEAEVAEEVKGHGCARRSANWSPPPSAWATGWPR